MEHSVQKYLERQTTEKLKFALQVLRKEEPTDQSLSQLAMVEEILQKRMQAAQAETKEE